MSSSSDSSSRGVSRDKWRKRDKERKHRESRSRSAQRNRDRSHKRSKDKVREKQKENKYRRKSKSRSRDGKRGRSRSSKHSSRNNSIELRSRSASRDKKQERGEKLRKERREKKYDTEVDKLKEKEIEKHKEYEKKLVQNQSGNENINKNYIKNNSINNLNSNNKNLGFKKNLENALDKKMTEEEKEEMLKKQRLAKARVFVLVEREEDKKNEEMLIENRGLIQDDFLEDEENEIAKNREKFRFDDEKHFDDMQSDNEMENEKFNDVVAKNNNCNIINIENQNDAAENLNTKIEIDDFKICNKNDKNENEKKKEEDNNLNVVEMTEENKINCNNKKINNNSGLNKIDEEALKINVSLGYRNMPHLPSGFFTNSSKQNNSSNKNNSKSKPLNKQKTDPLSGVSLSPKQKAASIVKPVEVEFEEDPLDAYMKTIEKDATLQDYQIYQELLNQQFQQKYDEAVARDSKSEAFSAQPRIPTASDEDEDHVKVIEDNAEMEIDESKIITLEDILKMNKQNLQEEIKNGKENNENNNNQLVLYHSGEDDFDKKFIETLKKANAPDFDPFFGYSNTNKNQEVVLYREDYNEYMKEDEFSGFAEEEAWLKLKKSTTEKKELKLVNHSLISYEPFRKNLYVESKENGKLTEEEVEKIRKENGEIKVRGKSIPNPIQNWFQCGLTDKIFNVLQKKGFVKPFPIQAQAIPCIMSGRDVIGIAETGSGKTLAFVLPMLRHVLDQRPLKTGEGPIGFIMAPTRELAFQIFSETKSFCKHLKLSVSCVYGGAGIGAQISELRRGAEIVICTPGRMIDVLCLSNGNVTNLRRVTYVVIDEADRMFDLGFEPQIARILANIRPDRQTVMFSATFPKQIESLAKKILNKPIEIVVGKRGQSCTNVQQFVEVRDDSSKLYRLLEILGEYSQENFGIIIFMDKQIEADELFKELFHLGYQSLVIHGGQDQEDRDFAIMDFKNGVRNILITTSVCARGLDVKHCGLVINFKCPNHMEDYVHRVGRTGRAGKTGVSFTFISPDEAHLAEDILRILEISKQAIPEELRNLVRSYKERLENGEVDKFRISGYVGRGYRFDEGEKEKVKQTRAGLKKGYSVDSDEDESMDIKGEDKKNDETGDTEASKKKYALQLFNKPKDEEKKKLISKDPKARQIAIECGMNAAKNAIIAGRTPEDAMKMAQQAIEMALAEYKPSVSTEKGVEQAAKIIEEWVERENEKNNIFTCELDINDYPNVTRGKVIKKDFLESMGEMTQCNIAIRGTFVEPGKKPPIGQKKLHLYIQGNTKTDVAHAYREFKKILDESALNFYTKGASMGMAGKTGKYSV